MELKTFFAQEVATGSAIPNPVATVYNAGTLVLATGLADEFNSSLPNPFNGDANGKISFRAPNGEYDLKVTGPSSEYTVRLPFLDAAEAFAGITLNDLGDVSAALSPSNNHGLIYDSTLGKWSSKQVISATPMMNLAFASPTPNGTVVTNPIPAGYYTVGRLMNSTGVPTFGVPTVSAAIAHTVSANEVYARPFLINRPTTFDRAGSYVVAVAAGQSASVRIYNASSAGRPNLAMHNKITISTAASGWVESVLPAPVTLQPGLYFALTTTTSTTATARACIDGLSIVLGYGGAQVTGLYQSASQTRLDLPNLSDQTWTVDVAVSSISATRDTFWFNFTSD